MAKASDIKRGMAIKHNGKLLLVKSLDVQSPSARGAATLYKVRFKDIESGLKVEERFKGDDAIEELELSRRPVNFSYVDGNEYVFMDSEDYTPFSFNQEDISEELLFIDESIQGLEVVLVNGQAAGIELPQSVELEITETSPSIKGASAAARTKPAHFATGLVIQVPEYLSSGTKVRINTAERRYMSRVD